MSAFLVHIPVPSTLDAAERAMIESTLAFFAGNKTRTAKTLGCCVNHIHNRLSEYARRDAAARKAVA